MQQLNQDFTVQAFAAPVVFAVLTTAESMGCHVSHLLLATAATAAVLTSYHVSLPMTTAGASTGSICQLVTAVLVVIAAGCLPLCRVTGALVFPVADDLAW